jgi:hypothetical protein
MLTAEQIEKNWGEFCENIEMNISSQYSHRIPPNSFQSVQL